MTEPKLGDYVCYSREWRRSTGNITGELPIRSGRIINMKDLGSCKLAIVEWTRQDIPTKENVKNLIRLDERLLESR